MSLAALRVSRPQSERCQRALFKVSRLLTRALSCCLEPREPGTQLVPSAPCDRAASLRCRTHAALQTFAKWDFLLLLLSPGPQACCTMTLKFLPSVTVWSSLPTRKLSGWKRLEDNSALDSETARGTDSWLGLLQPRENVRRYYLGCLYVGSPHNSEGRGASRPSKAG